MEWNIHKTCVPKEGCPIGYFLEVWLDDDSGPPLHTFECGEPVYLRFEMMGRTKFPIWWIERFEHLNTTGWNVRVRTDRHPSRDTDWKILPVRNLVPLPAMLRIALEAS